MQTRIHHLAVWILVIIHQFVGFGWYSVFGNIWLNQHAKTATDIEQTHNWTAYAFAVFAAIIVNYALAWLISRLHAHTAIAGFRISLFCWFAFLFVELATIGLSSAFETNPWLLVLIDMGRPLVAWSMTGLVLGAWRKSA